jgi:signal transduction histidine kinase
LARTPEDVCLEITDSGIINAGKAVEGIGMMGIRERMRQFKGTVAISSSEKGTKVTVALHVKTRSVN